MIDFTKLGKATGIQKQIDPVTLYNTLDRATDKGPLRPAQEAILSEWHGNHRNKRDLILKLHTGQGKTLVGLLILQSKLNESPGAALYLCPNKFLAQQTLAQASQFGIRVCGLPKSGVPSEFDNGQAILVTHIQALFNGRSRFGLGADYKPAKYVVVDDAHACIDSIRQAFVLKIERGTDLFDTLLHSFTEIIGEQGPGSLISIQENTDDALVAVPYWEWIKKSQAVTKYINDAYVKENELPKEKRSQLWFVWPLLQNIISRCKCFVSSSAIEISPYLPQLERFGTFDRAQNRIFMSATVSNDAFLVKGLRLSPETIRQPLVYSKEKWSGEKMVLIPSLLGAGLERDDMVAALAPMKIGRTFGVVALCPSFGRTLDWEKYGAVVVKSEQFKDRIDDLKSAQFDKVLVFANRYDGIDLPDSMCRFLILDSLPKGEMLEDRYEEECRVHSRTTESKRARAIEQGLGRSVRGERDFSVILLLGSDLVRFVQIDATRRLLSEQTVKQIEIGFEIASHIASQKENVTPMEALYSTVQQCINRDAGWKQYYINQMDECSIGSSHADVLHLLGQELKAEILWEQDKGSEAAAVIQTLADSLKETEALDKAWYNQEMARMLFGTDARKSSELQRTAWQKNKTLLRPNDIVGLGEELLISHERIENIIAWVRPKETFGHLKLVVDELLESLHFGIAADRFERTLKDLGAALGFPSQRPDKELKQGPDVLWRVDDSRFVLFECKSSVDPQRVDINKSEAAQMNTSCLWFSTAYPGCTASKRLIIPGREHGPAAALDPEILITNQKQLKALRENVKRFFAGFEAYDFKSISKPEVQQQLNTFSLSSEDFINGYGEKPISRH